MDIISKKSGFTLFELVIVLVLAAILTGVAIYKWSDNSINLNAQAKALVSDIRYTQNLAMTKGERYRLVIDSSTNSYQIVNFSGTPILNPSGTTTINLANGISFASLTNLPNNLIAFDGKGIPYIDAAYPGTALAAMATISLTASGETKTISINPETGQVSL